MHRVKLINVYLSRTQDYKNNEKTKWEGRGVPADFFLRPYRKFPGFLAAMPEISVIVPSPQTGGDFHPGLMQSLEPGKNLLIRTRGYSRLPGSQPQNYDDILSKNIFLIQCTLLQSSFYSYCILFVVYILTPIAY